MCWQRVSFHSFSSKYISASTFLEEKKVTLKNKKKLRQLKSKIVDILYVSHNDCLQETNTSTCYFSFLDTQKEKRAFLPLSLLHSFPFTFLRLFIAVKESVHNRQTNDRRLYLEKLAQVSPGAFAAAGNRKHRCSGSTKERTKECSKGDTKKG